MVKRERLKQKCMIAVCFLVILSATAFPTTTKAAELQNIEIFDVQSGRVVSETEANQNFQDKTALFLHNITDVYRSVNPLPREGYMIRVPFDPPVEISNQWLDGLIDEAVILYSREESPYLLLFDDENNSHFFHFDGDATSFMAEVQSSAVK